MSLTRFLMEDSSLVRMRSFDSVLDAVNEMVRAEVGSVIVESQDGSIEGIFTERDLMNRVVKNRIDATDAKLGEVMTREVIVLPRSATLDQAIALMAKHRIRHIPIVEESGEVLGVISLRRLLHDKIDQVVQALKVLEDFDDQVRGG